MAHQGELKRELGTFGATMMGLGAMIGTGVFVSIGIAAGVTGPSVVLAIGLAAIVATCNALSSAQLAASLPVSGGTYEYGYAYLTPWLGFTAGWMFLCAKAASAATATLGFAGYLLRAFGWEGAIVPVAFATVAVVAVVVLAGIRRSNRTNVVIVAATIIALLTFIIAGIATIAARGSQAWVPFFAPETGAPLAGLLEATALVFVAFTGYARIATLGEEVIAPSRTIPRAIMATLVITALLYLAVGAVGIATVGADGLAGAARSAAAPLAIAAQTFTLPWAAGVVAIGAMTAMLGVLLNLILGLSRVLLAMGRRRDMPGLFARVGARGEPMAATIAVAITIAVLVLSGSIKLTWSFSAFSVLIYYAITNIAALRLPATARRYPPAVAWTGLASCLFLAFWVDRNIWLAGLGLIAVGLIWHAVARRIART